MRKSDSSQQKPIPDICDIMLNAEKAARDFVDDRQKHLADPLVFGDEELSRIAGVAQCRSIPGLPRLETQAYRGAFYHELKRLRDSR